MSKRPHRRALQTPGLAEAIARIEEVRRGGDTSLSLEGLGLTELPDSIGQLTQLRELSLSRNKLTELPELVTKLTQLERLFLVYNQLEDLPETIAQLTELKLLGLGFNRFKYFPETILRLTHLEKLGLNSNQLTKLPESIGRLTQLRWLFVNDNKLTELPESLLHLAQLSHLDLGGNKALSLPAELLDASIEPRQVLEYYFRTRGKQRRPLNEAKLILVGRGAVGKTSIVNRLVHKTFKDEKKTEGIRITEWPLTVGRKKEDVRLNVWDFGGQEIMHATHQFFLTERSLYLLVLSGREGGEEAEAEYWLKLIQSFGGDSPVIVVLNKIKEHPFDVNRSGLQQKYKFIREFVRTQPEEIVPLPGQPGATVPYVELLAWEQSGTKKFPKVVDGSVVEIDVDALLNGVELEGERARGREGDERVRAARIFVSYSHKDERLLNELKTHLSPLRRLKLIETWDDREIEAGEDWREKINDNLERADLIILLVSAAFIASDYCFEKEMGRALERHAKKEARVIPVIVREANWKLIPPLAELQAVPKGGKPVTKWANKDSAWLDVSERIQKVIEDMNAADPRKRRAR